MDLRQLEIIRAIAETGSFTAAGEKLHVSQSAISRQILILEDELGEPVFHRIGRRIRITPAGESLLQLSHRAVSRPARHRVGDQRHARVAARIDRSGGRHDCLPLRVPGAPRRGETHPSQSRHASHRRQHPALHRDAPIGGRRSRAADASHRGVRSGFRPAAAGRAAARVPTESPAGGPETDRRRPTSRNSPSSCSRPARSRGASSRTSSAGSGSRRRSSWKPRTWRSSRRWSEAALGSASSRGRPLRLTSARISSSAVESPTSRCDRQTGWRMPEMGRLPRAVTEVMRVFETMRPQLEAAVRPSKMA